MRYTYILFSFLILLGCKGKYTVKLEVIKYNQKLVGNEAKVAGVVNDFIRYLEEWSSLYFYDLGPGTEGKLYEDFDLLKDKYHQALKALYYGLEYVKQTIPPSQARLLKTAYVTYFNCLIKTFNSIKPEIAAIKKDYSNALKIIYKGVDKCSSELVKVQKSVLEKFGIIPKRILVY